MDQVCEMFDMKRHKERLMSNHFINHKTEVMLRDFEKSINQMESPFFHVFEEFEVFEKMEY